MIPEQEAKSIIDYGRSQGFTQEQVFALLDKRKYELEKAKAEAETQAKADAQTKTAEAEVETEEVKPYEFKFTAEEKEKPGDLLLTEEAKKEREEKKQQKKTARIEKEKDKKDVDKAINMNANDFTNFFYGKDFILPGVRIYDAGKVFGNAVTVRIPGKGEMYIDLKSDKQEDKDKIQEILDYSKSTKDKNLAYLETLEADNQHETLSEEQIKEINSTWGEAGFEVKMLKPGFTNPGRAGVDDTVHSFAKYSVTKDGKEIFNNSNTYGVSLIDFFSRYPLSDEESALILGTPDDPITKKANDGTGILATEAREAKIRENIINERILDSNYGSDYDEYFDDNIKDDFIKSLSENEEYNKIQKTGVQWGYLSNEEKAKQTAMLWVRGQTLDYLEEDGEGENWRRNKVENFSNNVEAKIRDLYNSTRFYRIRGGMDSKIEGEKFITEQEFVDEYLPIINSAWGGVYKSGENVGDENSGLKNNVAKYTAEKQRIIRETSTELRMRDSGIPSFSRASAYHTQFQLEKRKENLELETKKFSDLHSESINNIQVEINSISNTAAKDGVTSIEYDETGGFYTVEAKTPAIQQRYQKRLNKIAKDSKDIKEDQEKTLENLNDKWNAYHASVNDPKLSAIISASDKNYNLADILANDVNDSFEGMLLDVPIFFGSESAKQRKNEMQESAAIRFESMQRGGDAWDTSNTGRYIFRTIGQQSAPVATAIVGMGGGGAIIGGLRGANIASSATAGFYGLTSAGAKRQELENLEDAAIKAQASLDKLLANEDKYDPKDFKEIKSQLEETIADGTMDSANKWATIIGSGIIEGTVTKWFGTIPNASKMLRNFTNPLDDMMAAGARNGWQNTANALKTISLRTGGELVEEELIALGTMGTEALFLGKEADYSQLTEVALSAIILGGSMNGPGVSYSTLMSHMRTRPYYETFKNVEGELKRIKNDFGDLDKNDPNYDAKRKALQDLRRFQLDRVSNITEEMEVGVMLLGADNMGKLVTAGNQLNAMDQQAGVDPTLSEEAQQKQRDVYLSTLDRAEAKQWKKSYELALGSKNKIMDKLDFTNAAERLYGPEGKKIVEKLTKKDPSLKKDPKKLAIEVHKEFKKQMDGRAIAAAKADPSVKAGVENRVYGLSKEEALKRGYENRSDLENELYLKFGKQVSLNKTNTVMNNKSEAINAASVLGDKRLSNIELKDGKTDEQMQEEVLNAYDEIIQREIDLVDKGGKSKIFKDENNNFLDYSKMSTEDKANHKDAVSAKYYNEAESIIDELRMGETNGAIVGDKYIVRDRKAAKAELDNGNLLAGTVLSHEISHAVDALAFEVDEQGNRPGLVKYAKLLFEWTQENTPQSHSDAMFRAFNLGHINMEYFQGVEGGEILVDEQLFWDEYTKSIQDSIQNTTNRSELAAMSKLGQSFSNVFRGIVNGDYKINTSRDAAVYMANYLNNFKQGKLGELQKRRIDVRKSEAKKKEGLAEVRKSENIKSPILHEQANEVGKKVNNLYAAKDSNPNYAFDIANLYDNMIGKYLTRIENEGAILGKQVEGIVSQDERLKNIADFKMNAMYSERGIIDLIGKFNPNEMVDVVDPITGEIVQEANTLSRYLNGVFPQRLPEFTKNTTIDFGGFKVDISKAENIVTTESDQAINDILTPEVQDQLNTPLLSNLQLNKDQVKLLRDTIYKVVGRKLPALDAVISKNKSITPLIAALKKEFGVKHGDIHKIVYELMGDSKFAVEEFLKNPKNKKAILDSLTTTWLAKHLPMAVQKEVNGIGWTTDHKGRTKGTKSGQINFWRSSEEGPYKGMTDGKQKIRRNPNAMKDVTNAMLLSLFAKGKTMTNIKRAGLEKLSLVIAQEIGIEAFKADMINDGELKDLFVGRQELFDRVLADNFVEEFVRQSERGVVKRSGNVNPMVERNLALEVLDALLRFPGETNQMAFEKELIQRGIPLELAYSFDLDKLRDLISDQGINGYKDPVKLYGTTKDASDRVKGIVNTYANMGSFSQKDQKKANEARIFAAKEIGNLVDALPLEAFLSPVITPAFFGFSSSNRGFWGNPDAKDNKASNKAKAEMKKLEDKIKAKRQEAKKKRNELYKKNPTLVTEMEASRLFNAGQGLMGKVETEFQYLDLPQEEKQRLANEKYGNEIEAANKANPKLLSLIQNTFLELASKDNNSAIGMLYYNEMATNNTSGQRSLSTWYLTQWENGSQGLWMGKNTKTGKIEYFRTASAAMKRKTIDSNSVVPNEKHPNYAESRIIAEDKARKLVAEGKLEDNSAAIEEEIFYMLYGGEGNAIADKTKGSVKNWGTGLLRGKGEHITASANIMADVSITMLKALDSGDINNAKTSVENTISTFEQSLGAESLSFAQDVILGSTSKLGGIRIMSLAQVPFTKIDSFKTFDGKTATNIAVEQAAKHGELQNINRKIRELTATSPNVIKNINTLDKAKSVARRSTNPTKGMSAWDFDDTVARTKSGVIARIPNTSGKPMPGRKVIFLAGGAGSGKSNVVKQLGLEKQGFNIVNQDISLEWLKKNSGLPADMKDLTPEQLSKLGKLQWEARKIAARKQMKFKGRGDGIIVDGTGASMNVMNKQVQEFKDAGYEVQMLFVETSLETAIKRNAARKERTLRESIVRKNHEKVQSNKEGFRKLFGNNFAEVKTDNLKIGDPMPQRLVNKINSFATDFEVRRLTAEEFAVEGADILEQGGEFDFREFDVVTEGEKGPLFGKAMDRAKKYGLKDNYILTARPHAAKKPIYEFLKSQGLEIPLDNIITLENSTPEAKALWLAEKASEGYNDIYFADDALQNVQAVDNMLEQFDIKRKVQQAKRSANTSKEFNKMLEGTKGLPSEYKISQAKARQRGKKIGRFRLWIPPSADDFAGLLQMFQGKGEQGMKDAAWLKEHLLDPFARGDRSLNGARQRTAEEFKALRKKFPKVSKKLRKVIPTGDYTFGDAIRVYLWDKNGIEIPGLSKTDQAAMVELVKGDPELQAFADVLGVLSRKEDGYIAPDEYWMTKDIVADITEDGIIGDGRKEHLAEWIENKDLIFTPENLNKIEFLYGSNFREALEDILYRMENGSNRPTGSNRIVNNFLNWLNGGISVVMNWNTRSALLQTLSTVNFINWGDNNMLAAAKAFANQKQFWTDSVYIFNSDMLRQRRAGLKTTIESNELMSEVEGAVNPVRAAIRYLLRVGFTPTKIADSFAIAMGGSSFYRNRIKTYEKQGYSTAEAEAKAWLDFQETAEEAQQSSRPDRISMQQASTLGRIILAFQNTPMQYMRMSKKEVLDLVNGRYVGMTGENSVASKVGKILYYTAVQNLIFYTMQTALFAAMFDDDEDDEEFFNKKREMVANNMADGVLRGLGVGGAVVSTIKNIILKYIANKDSKMYDESAILMEALKLSPPLSIKARQILSADKTMRYNRDVIKEMETFDIDNPMWNAVFNVVEMTTNAPLSRMESKYKNVRNALNNEYELWQRVAFMLGYNKWSLGLKDKEIEEIKKEIKAIKTFERKKKAQEKKQKEQAEAQGKVNKQIEKEKELQEKGVLVDPKCRHVSSKGERCNISVAKAGDLCTVHEEKPQRADGKKVQCKKVKKGGKRCKMQTSNKSGYCYYHD